MTKKELIKWVAMDTNLPKKVVEEVLNAYVEVVAEQLSDGEKVQIVGFGTFETRDRVARTGRSIHTGEKIDIQASKTIRFHAGKTLRDAVNN